MLNEPALNGPLGFLGVRPGLVSLCQRQTRTQVLAFDLAAVPDL